MICSQCRQQCHEECESPDCFCQHRTRASEEKGAHFGCGT